MRQHLGNFRHPLGLTPGLLLLLAGAACEESRVSPDSTAQVDSGVGDLGHVDLPPAADLDSRPLPRFTSGPTLLPAPNPRAPLAAVVEFTTDQPVSAALEIRSGQDGRLVTFTGSDTSFSLPVLELEPDQSFSVEVLISAQGREVRGPEPLVGATPPLPGGFPPLEATLSEASRMEPGVILLNPFLAMSATREGFAVAVNEAGRVVWFYEHEEENKSVAKRLANGNLIFLGPAQILEVDMLGNAVHAWNSAAVVDSSPNSTPVSATLFHHDLLELPSGNLLFLSRELRSFESYPTSATDPQAPDAPAQVAGDLILEMQRDGTIIQTWPLLDLLDPYRVSYSSLKLKKFPTVWPGVELRDWSHANGLAYDEAEDTIIVSVRHQDAVIKFSRQSGELLWILGPHHNWTAPWSERLLTPAGDLQWPYHAHAPQITERSTIMLFDNGNYRASPFDPKTPLSESYSRAAEFSVDAQKMTVSQLWSFGDPVSEQFYSSSVSSAYQLPLTGNVLVTEGNLTTDPAGKPASGPTALFWARIVEVTHTDPPEKVFELTIKDETVLGPGNWRVYRSQKLPSLYPPQLAQVEPLP